MTGFGDAGRTWLGYVTFNQVGNPGSSNGTATVTRPGDADRPGRRRRRIRRPDSARGLDQLYTFGYPVSRRRDLQRPGRRQRRDHRAP